MENSFLNKSKFKGNIFTCTLYCILFGFFFQEECSGLTSKALIVIKIFLKIFYNYERQELL